jgi:hypothetical protein
MKLSTKITIAFAILVVTIIVACSLCPSRTRTDTVKITDIDDGYEVFFRTDGRVLSPPISAEGLFPRWGQGAVLYADGSGERVQLDGVMYRKYILGRDLRATVFSSCVLYISEAKQRLIVQGNIIPGRGLIDRSGTYNNVTIDHPQVISLVAGAKIGDIDEQYIRARGRFDTSNYHSRFQAAGITFEAACGPVDAQGEYDVIGFVRVYNGTPNMSIKSCKSVSKK